MVRKRVDVAGYDRTRRGRREHVPGYSREQEIRGAHEPPSMMALRRPSATAESKRRQVSLRDATREVGVLQRRLNARNSTAPLREAVDELAASLRRGDPNLRLASELPVHLVTVDRRETFQDVIRYDMRFAEEHPGYVAHGYATTDQRAYEILERVRNDIGVGLPGE